VIFGNDQGEDIWFRQPLLPVHQHVQLLGEEEGNLAGQINESMRSSALFGLLFCAAMQAQTPTFIAAIRTAQYEQFWLNESPIGGYVAYGTVSDSVDLDPSGNDIWITPMQGYEEAFIAGYDIYGEYLWHKQFRSTLTLRITQLSFTEDGQFYLSGDVSGSGDLDAGPNVAEVSCNCTDGPPGFETDHRTGWYGKFTAQGEHLWHQQFGNDLDGRSAVRVEYSPFSHDLFLFGSVISAGAVDFDPGPGEALITPTPFSSGQGYVNTNIYARYDSSGTLDWFRNYGGNVVDVVRWDDGTAEYFYLTGDAITGSIPGTLQDHDPGPGVLQPYNPIDLLNDVYASKFNADGELEWCRFFFGGNGTGIFNENEGGTSVVVDGDGDVFVAGVFQSNYSTTPGGSLLSMAPFGGSASDALLLKLDGADGSVLWERHMGSSGEDTFGAVCALDDMGRVYVASTFENTAELNSAGSSVQVTANGPSFTKDSFVACFDPNGQVVFSGTIGGPEYDGITQLLPSGHALCLVGNFRNTADLDMGPGVAYSTSMAFHDPFFACYDLSGLALGITGQADDASNLALHPNPARDHIDLVGVGSRATVDVFDGRGRAVGHYSDARFIDVTDWAPGIYTARVSEGALKTCLRFIVTH